MARILDFALDILVPLFALWFCVESAIHNLRAKQDTAAAIFVTTSVLLLAVLNRGREAWLKRPAADALGTAKEERHGND